MIVVSLDAALNVSEYTGNRDKMRISMDTNICFIYRQGGYHLLFK